MKTKTAITPRDYVVGTFLLLILGIPLAGAFLMIASAYWTCAVLRAVASETHTRWTTFNAGGLRLVPLQNSHEVLT